MAPFGLLIGLIGGLIIYLRRPLSEVLVVTNAGQYVPVYKGKTDQAQRIGKAIGQAIVSN